MIAIRDFRFGAWLIIKHHAQYEIENGILKIDIDKTTLRNYRKVFADTDEPIMRQMSMLIKEVNAQRNNLR